MSSGQFSNANTGSKPADPYTAKNKDDPTLSEKVEDLSNFISASKFGMMTTHTKDSNLLVSRCMALAAKVRRRSYPHSNHSSSDICLLQESGGIDLIFHTNTESGKTDDISSDSAINIAFLNISGEWASISGKASILTDRATVKKYYSPTLKAWLGDLGDGTHDGGENDPRIGVIKVETKTVTYQVVRKSIIGRAVEMVQGVVTGEAPAVGKLREISESEISEWRSSH